jgi:predicted ABC-type ATPase
VPQVIIIAGPNGAGKTTFAGEYLSGRRGQLVFVNADEIVRELADHGLSRAELDVRAGRIMLERIDDLAQAGADFMFETTLATRSYASKIVAWRKRKYSVSLIYLRLPSVEASIARVRRRVEVGGHDVPEDIIRRRFDKSRGYFETVYKPLVDEWYVRDSGEGTFTLAESWDQNDSPT